MYCTGVALPSTCKVAQSAMYGAASLIGSSLQLKVLPKGTTHWAVAGFEPPQEYHSELRVDLFECVGGSDLVHFVDGDGQLSDTERAHQQGVFPGLTAGLEARLKLPAAGVHHQHGHVGLHRGHEERDDS